MTNLPRELRYSAQQLYLFADRSSCMKMTSNQLRLWFSAMGYVLMNELRRRALRGTEFAEATCQTIRLELFKIGGLVGVSVRRVAVSLSTGYLYRELFMAAHLALRGSHPLQC